MVDFAANYTVHATNSCFYLYMEVPAMVHHLVMFTTSFLQCIHM